MSCFKCSKCGCVENTALSLYWVRRDQPALCSECDPKIGKWHNWFPKEPATGLLLASDGFLYDPREVETEGFQWRVEHQGLKIVGEA